MTFLFGKPWVSLRVDCIVPWCNLHVFLWRIQEDTCLVVSAAWHVFRFTFSFHCLLKTFLLRLVHAQRSDRKRCLNLIDCELFQNPISVKSKKKIAFVFAFVHCEQTRISLCVLHLSDMYIERSKTLFTLTACDCDCVTILELIYATLQRSSVNNP